MKMTKEEVYGTMSFLQNEYREIITKAVCGRGRKLIKSTNELTPSNKPSSILGCWVINHVYHAKKKCAETVEVHGTYDINVWYAFNDNRQTEVVLETVSYCDEIVLSNRDSDCFQDDDDVIAKVIKQPHCLQCKINKKGNKIKVEVEREFEVKVIGETKVNVRVEPVRHQSDDRHKIKKDHHYQKGDY